MKHSNLDIDIEALRDELLRDVDAMYEKLLTLKINLRDGAELNPYAEGYVISNFGRMVGMICALRAYDWALQSIEDENRPEQAA